MGQPACDRCRSKHISCNRQAPCDHCIKGNVGETCHYSPRKTSASSLNPDGTPRRKRLSNILSERESPLAAGDVKKKPRFSKGPGNVTTAADIQLETFRNALSLTENFVTGGANGAGLSQDVMNDIYSLKNLTNGEEIFGNVIHIPLINISNAHLYPPMILFLPHHHLNQECGSNGGNASHALETISTGPIDLSKQFEIYEDPSHIGVENHEQHEVDLIVKAEE